MLKREQTLIQQKLQAEMAKQNFDAMIITSPEAIYYCTGMASMFMYSSNRVGMALAVMRNKVK